MPSDHQHPPLPPQEASVNPPQEALVSPPLPHSEHPPLHPQPLAPLPLQQEALEHRPPSAWEALDPLLLHPRDSERPRHPRRHLEWRLLHQRREGYSELLRLHQRREGCSGHPHPQQHHLVNRPHLLQEDYLVLRHLLLQLVGLDSEHRRQLPLQPLGHRQHLPREVYLERPLLLLQLEDCLVLQLRLPHLQEGGCSGHRLRHPPQGDCSDHQLQLLWEEPQGQEGDLSSCPSRQHEKQTGRQILRFNPLAACHNMKINRLKN